MFFLADLADDTDLFLGNPCNLWEPFFSKGENYLQKILDFVMP